MSPLKRLWHWLKYMESPEETELHRQIQQNLLAAIRQQLTRNSGNEQRTPETGDRN